MRLMVFLVMILGYVLTLLWLALISLPGIGVTYLGWKLSRNMQPVFLQAAFRSGLIAIALTPSLWGHGFIVPAIFLAAALQGHDRLAGIVPIVVVWAIALPLLAIYAARQTPKVLRQSGDSRAPRLR
jgi:hypothetical protein